MARAIENGIWQFHSHYSMFSGSLLTTWLIFLSFVFSTSASEPSEADLQFDDCLKMIDSGYKVRGCNSRPNHKITVGRLAKTVDPFAIPDREKNNRMNLVKEAKNNEIERNQSKPVREPVDPEPTLRPSGATCTLNRTPASTPILTTLIWILLVGTLLVGIVTLLYLHARFIHPILIQS